MENLRGRVALVTGASRGVGKGVALALGEAGATVYVTGRTVSDTAPTVPLEGTVYQTAQEVTAIGGNGIAAPCDHRDDAQVTAVFERIKQEQGRLDILVNNAWAGYEGYVNGKHMPPDFAFWDKPISYWDDNLDGLRWTYVSTWHAASCFTAQKSGMIFNVSFNPGIGNPAYNIAKWGTDQLTAEFAHAFRDYHVAVVSLYPGLVRTEGVMMNAQYFDMSTSESPQNTGRAVVALATDPTLIAKSGLSFTVRQLAIDYDFNDIDGTRPAL